MTWAEFKAAVEAAGVVDATLIDYIDVSGDQEIEDVIIGVVDSPDGRPTRVYAET